MAGYQSLNNVFLTMRANSDTLRARIRAYELEPQSVAWETAVSAIYDNEREIEDYERLYETSLPMANHGAPVVQKAGRK